jgi:hypothetical protein
MVEAMLLSAYGLEVNVTSTKGSVKGRQTAGGVKALFSGKITFKGLVTAGPDIDRPVRGTFRGKGEF